jgi:hypothetical protein
VPFHYAASRSQQEREREIGRCIRKHVRRVADKNTFARCSGNVDIIEAHGNIGDNLQTVK